MAGNAPRLPGQRKLIRYRHTASCIRISGRIPEEEARRQQIRRRRVLAILLLLVWLIGFAAL